MLPIPSHEVGQPTCNIVVQKEGEAETVCGQPATQMVSLVNPDDQTQVLAIVLLCDVHDHALEEGKSLIAVSENGAERIGVQYKTREGDVNHDANETDGAATPDGA